MSTSRVPASPSVAASSAPVLPIGSGNKVDANKADRAAQDRKVPYPSNEVSLGGHGLPPPCECSFILLPTREVESTPKGAGV